VIEPTFVTPLASEYSAPGGPWFEQTLGHLLQDMPRRPDLIVTDRGVLGSDELLALTQAVAGGLRARGVQRGDAIAWQLPNCLEAAILYCAAWWLGAVAVPLHQQLTAREVEAVLAQLEGVTLLSDADVNAPLLEGLQKSPVRTSPAAPGDVAVVLTTSGSSGRPKSVIHTQRTVAHKARQLAILHGTGIDDAVLVPAPMAHLAGMFHGLLHPVSTGVKAVVMQGWDSARGLELVRSQRVTMLFGPPVFALGIAAAPGFSRDAVESIRLIAGGGTTITEDFAREMSATYGAVVKRTYGSTEAPFLTTSLPGDPVERGWTTDGRVAPGADVQLRDPVSGAIAPAEDGRMEGEVWVRGPELAEGYVDREQTDAAFIEGWFRTWDLAVIEDGWFRVTGRSADIIIRGGANISASEVEGALEQHPAIRQAVVVGYPDDVYGERIGAFVVADEAIDRERCVEWFAEYGLAKYKVPDRVVVVDAIPVLPTFQKPDRNVLRERMRQDVEGEP
jgi:acyl-CoA synthetase (AMP-forming)/AMP-acid ligase II